MSSPTHEEAGSRGVIRHGARRWSALAWSTRVLLVCAASFILLMAMPGPRFGYDVTDLGTLGGGGSEARINNNGQVVGGASRRANQHHAFLWSPGTGTKDLGAFGGGNSLACSVNDSGQVVGIAEPESKENKDRARAFLWSPGTGMQDLGTLGEEASDRTFSNVGINNNGQVVGGTAFGGAHTHAFLSSPGRRMQDLGTLGGEVSFAVGINNAGQVVGGGRAGEQGKKRPRGPGARIHMVTRKRDAGPWHPRSRQQHRVLRKRQSAGRWYGRVGRQGRGVFLWLPGGEMRDIGTLAGGSGMACCVNGKGQVVGWCTTETSEEYARLGFPYEDQPKRAFLFSDGKMDDLNAMIDPASGWRLHRAAGINDAGQIVGSGEDQARQPHAFLLTPVPRRSPLFSGASALPPCWPSRGEYVSFGNHGKKRYQETKTTARDSLVAPKEDGDAAHNPGPFRYPRSDL